MPLPLGRSPHSRLAAAGVLAAVLATGCAGGDPTPDSGSKHQGHTELSEISHGVHGMPELPSPPESAGWNATDAAFMTMMIAHHRQALDLSELAETRVSDPRVRRIAETIDVTQGREIIVMASWLVRNGLPEPTVDDVEQMTEGGGMPGMLSIAQVDGLAATEAAEFDRRFLEDMIQHHQGAIGMAEDAVLEGEDIRVKEMATDIAAGQTSEIGRMRQLLMVLP